MLWNKYKIGLSKLWSAAEVQRFAETDLSLSALAKGSNVNEEHCILGAPAQECRRVRRGFGRSPSATMLFVIVSTASP